MKNWQYYGLTGSLWLIVAHLEEGGESIFYAICASVFYILALLSLKED